MKLYHETAAFDAALKSIVTCGKKLDNSIHRFAVSAALHTAVNGNPHWINELIANMPAGSRVNALREWFTNFGPVSYSEKTKLFVTDKEHAASMVSEIAEGAVLPIDLEAGLLQPWTEFKPDPEYQTMDFAKVIKIAVVKAQERLTADKGDTIDPVLLAKVQELVAAE